MTRYEFDFISNYDGVSDYRLYIDGKVDTRFKVESATRRCFYNDMTRRVIGDELHAFNAMQRTKHEIAKLKYPDIEPFQEYTS